MKLPFSSREQRTMLLVVGLAVVITWVYGSYILGPLRREAMALGPQVRNAREQLKALQAATANEAALREQYREVDETVRSLRNLLPAEEELPAVIELLSGLASQAQVKIQTIFPQRPLGSQESVPGPSLEAGAISEASVYKDVMIQVEALAGYHQLGQFLNLVEIGDKPMRVANLRITGDPKEPKRHHVKLLLRAYFATSASAAIDKSPAMAPMAHASGKP